MVVDMLEGTSHAEGRQRNMAHIPLWLACVSKNFSHCKQMLVRANIARGCVSADEKKHRRSLLRYLVICSAMNATLQWGSTPINALTSSHVCSDLRIPTFSTMSLHCAITVHIKLDQWRLFSRGGRAGSGTHGLRFVYLRWFQCMFLCHTLLSEQLWWKSWWHQQWQ